MIGITAFLIKEIEEAHAALKTWLRGDPNALKSHIESTQTTILCPEAKDDAESMSEATRKDRPELHFKVALHRDLRYSLAGSQYCLRLAAHNNLRSQYETTRAKAPLENFDQ